MRSNERFVLDERPWPEVGPSDVLVAPLVVGVCGTDLQMLSGLRPDRASVLGHEGIVRVIGLGMEVDDLSVGDLAIINPVDPVNQDIVVGHSHDGLLQEVYLVEGRARAHGGLVRASRTTPLICGALAEPIGTALYGRALTVGPRLAPFTVVVGAGPIGLIHMRLALMGGGRVALVGRSTERIEQARGLGLVPQDVPSFSYDGVANRVLEWTHGVGAAAAFICTDRTGTYAAVSDALDYAADGGCIDVVGGVRPTDSTIGGVDLERLRRLNVCGVSPVGAEVAIATRRGARVRLLGHRGTSPKHIRAALRVLGAAIDTFAPLVTHIVAPDDLSVALDEYRHSDRIVQGRPCVKMAVRMWTASEVGLEID